MLLSIDTSSKACSCALIDKDKLISQCYINTGLTHSATIIPLVENCIAMGGVTFNDIDSFAVSQGPGSYTGLRIGIATVKGMATPKNALCCGVSTLLGLSYNVRDYEGDICAVLDARVGQVFTALFSAKNGVITRETDDMAITIEELSKLLPKTVMAVGDGAKLLKEKIKTSTILLPDDGKLYQNAVSVGFAALDLKEFKSAKELTPQYKRLSQAEREREEKLNNK